MSTGRSTANTKYKHMGVDYIYSSVKSRCKKCTMIDEIMSLSECHDSDSVSSFNLAICTQSGHRVGLSRMGFRIGASIVRLHLQVLEVQSAGSMSGKISHKVSSTYELNHGDS